LAPHRKFAIRSTFVRRTIVEQTAENRVAVALLRVVYAIAQMRSVLRASLSREAESRATVATSMAFINGDQRDCGSFRHGPMGRCDGAGTSGLLEFVMPGLVPGIHVFASSAQERREWPGQARP
jgi:hypothetical protein